MQAIWNAIKFMIDFGSLAALVILLALCWKIDQRLDAAADKAKALEEAIEASKSNLREWKSDMDKALKLPRDSRSAKP